MGNMLVLGAGNFGKRAVEVLLEAGNKVIVVDRDARALYAFRGSNLTAVCAGGIEYLVAQEIKSFDWIIPALPMHVAFEWLAKVLHSMEITCRQMPVPKLSVPNPLRGKDGALYASFASHLCPPDCPEPDGACYVTGEQRTVPLHRLLAGLTAPGFDIEVVQSHQLFPGLGGLNPVELKVLLEKTISRRNSLIVATSCACHAVLDALSF
ncbi:MAG: NAD-binding protein [Dethiobacter sp.]|jgi:hypothetical protein|nr:NAD-binding protein [Dethiobacter sp.]